MTEEETDLQFEIVYIIELIIIVFLIVSFKKAPTPAHETKR